MELYPQVSVAHDSEKVKAPRPWFLNRMPAETNPNAVPAFLHPHRQGTYPHAFHGFVNFGMSRLRLHAHGQCQVFLGLFPLLLLGMHESDVI